MSYAPIDSYGLIGNMRTAALVGRDGSIDWLCLPHFDSPSVFAALLDHRKGGRFQIIAKAAPLAVRHYYIPDTNVLVTRMRTVDAVGEVVDFMPVGESRHDVFRPDLIRIVRVEHGRMRFAMRCQPAFDYARQQHLTHLTPQGAVFECHALAMAMSSTVDLQQYDGSVEAEFDLAGGQSAAFSIVHGSSFEVYRDGISITEADDLLHDTISFWRHWLSRCTYAGRWREWVRRSALVLKLMTFAPSGAIVAAPTCSLPEQIGGSRNWDYRYTWLRDAAFVVYALLRIGFTEEAGHFMSWLQQRSHEIEPDRMLRPVYGIDGRHELPETELYHLEGYRASKPVRIGNAACDQLQLDIYGSLMDAAYLHNKHASPLSYDMWCELHKLLDWVARNWHLEDNGIWEMRSKRRHFVNSKLMCWVAMDRGLRLADARSFPSNDRVWRKNRDAIYRELMHKGWNDQLQAFVQHYDTTDLDAANLIMPLVFFISPDDPRMISTLRAISRPPSQGGLVSDLVVHRYNPEKTDDGVGGKEGAFNMCTFWMVEALTRAGRLHPASLDRARLLFERMLASANELGLFSEQAGWNGEALGNYPQGLTHLSLISAAFNLDRSLKTR